MKIKRPGATEPQRGTQADAARLLGVSRKTIHEWSRKPGFPESIDGKYTLIDVYDWWRETIAGVTIGPQYDMPDGGGSGKTKTELECEKLEVENERKRLKLEQERGKLVSREAVRNEIERLFHRIRSRFESAPEELASSLPPELRADYLMDAKMKVSLILRELEADAG